MPQDVKKCQIYAGKKICFEPEEVTQMKLFDKPGCWMSPVYCQLLYGKKNTFK